MSVPPRPAEKSGQRRRWRERAARPLPPGGSATVGCGAPPLLHPWLRAPPGSAPLGSGALTRRLPRLPGRRPAGSSPGRGARSTRLARVDGFPGAKNFASVPTSIPASLSPSPRGAPTPWARARTRTHTPTRRRACARPRAPSRGVSSAPRQIALFRAPRLTQASSRHGASSVCGSGGRGGGGNSGRSPAPRLAAPCPAPSPGAAEKEDAEARRSRAAPGARLQGAGCLRSRVRGPR